MVDNIVIPFRLPQDWLDYLDTLVKRYSFNSRGELLSLALTTIVYYTITDGLKLKGKITGSTAVVAARVNVSTYRLIKDICCKRLKDTASVWAALAECKWLQDLIKEDKKQQKKEKYFFWVKDFARDYRKEVASLQYEIDKMGAHERP